MKRKNMQEVEREFKFKFVNDENEEDYFRITFEYDEDRKMWRTNLQGEYEEEELEAVKKALNEINKNHRTRIEINFEKEKK